jgi:hypothetical protein
MSSIATSSQSSPLNFQIITDATGSMGTFLSSLRISLVQILNLLKIVSPDSQVGFRAYRDMTDGQILEDVVMKQINNKSHFDALIQLAESLTAFGGDDEPEAAKLGLAQGLMENSVNEQTIVLLYADAPPHSLKCHKTNATLERKHLASKGFNKYNDWVTLCRAYQALGARVYFFGVASIEFVTLTQLTQGCCFDIGRYPLADYITNITMNVVLAILGYGDRDIGKYLPKIYSSRIVENFLSKKMSKVYQESLMYNTGLDERHTSSHILAKWQKQSLTDIPNRFKKDELFRNMVFEVVESLLNVQHVFSLTTNPIFGTLWRCICCCRDDLRRDKLIETMGSVKSSKSLSSSQLTTLNEWLEQSYNQTEEIQEFLQEFIKTTSYEHTSSYKALSLCELPSGASVQPTTKELLEVGRDCNPTSLSRLTQLLTHLTLVKVKPQIEKDDESKEEKKKQTEMMNHIPLDLPNVDLFGLIPHLLCPGTRFSLRISVILASLVYLADIQILKQRATEFLLESKGKWFSKDQSENFSYGFVKLMNKLPRGLALTDEEYDSFHQLKLLSGFSSNLKSPLNILTGYKPDAHASQHPDYRFQCDHCKNHRSFTLMTKNEDGKLFCVFCIEIHNHSKHTDESKEEKKQDDQSQSLSHLSECRSCHSLYSVARPSLLNVEPKCHYCRVNARQDKRLNINCHLCQNSFVDPAGLFQDLQQTWICKTCVVGHHNNNNKSISPQVCENSDIISNFLLNTSEELLQEFFGIRFHRSRCEILKGNVHSLLSLAEMMKINILKDDSNNYNIVFNADKSKFKYQGKPILNIYSIVKEIQDKISSGESQLEECFLCCRDDVKSCFMDQTCGTCKSRSCHECLTKWYGSLKSGHPIVEARLACPFCKHGPKASILVKFNREACAIRRVIFEKTKTKQTSNMIYMWCKQCNCVKPWMERQCAVATNTDTNDDRHHNLVCEECTEKKQLEDEKHLADPLLMGKACPSCTIFVYKTVGCDHMTCRCGKHWCYECAEFYAETSGPVYQHIQDQHSTLSNDLQFYYDQNQEDEDDD